MNKSLRELFHIQRALSSLTAFVLLLGGASSVMAQDESDSNSGQLEEVVVTAERRSADLQKTAISITAITEEKLEALGVRETGDVARYVPNLKMSKQPSSSDNFGLSMRGVAVGETAILADPSIALYIDGVYVAKQIGSAFDIVDLERIEVLRGPQGTLYGRNTVGGAVNIITKKPSDEFGFEARLGTGSYSKQNAKFTLDTGNWGWGAAKISALFSSTDGYLKNSAKNNEEGPIGQDENVALRAALRLTPSDRMTIDLSFENNTSESLPLNDQITNFLRAGTTGTITSQAAADASATYNDTISKYYVDESKLTENEITNFAAVFSYEVSDSMQFKALLSQRKWENSGDATSDFGSYQAGSIAGASPTTAQHSVYVGSGLVNNIQGVGSLRFGSPVPVGTPISLFWAERQSDAEQTTLEFQLNGSALDEKLQYTAGLYIFSEEVNESNPQNFVLPASFYLAGQSANTTGVGTQAFFCQTIGGPAQSTATIPGGRYNAGCVQFLQRDILLTNGTFRSGGETDASAVFGQVSYQVSDLIGLTAGLRLTNETKNAYLENDASPANGLNDQVNAPDKDYDNISGQFTVNFNLTEDMLAYAKVSQGYKSGGYNARASSVVTFLGSFNEETLASIEGGFKGDFLDNRLRLNAAVYQNVYDDRQVSQFVAGAGGAASQIVNAGKQTTTGMELELAYLPLDNLLINFGVGTIDAEYDEFVTGWQDPATGLPLRCGADAIVADATKPYVCPMIPILNPVTRTLSVPTLAVAHAPELNWSLVVNYRLPLSIGELAFQVDAAYEDGYVYHPILNQDDSADEKTLIGFNIQWRDIALAQNSVLDVTLWGKNITDEEYREWGIDFATLGYRVNTYGEPATYGLDVAYRY